VSPLLQLLLDALLLVFWLSLPPLLVALAVGVLIGLVQAVMQIQDQALGHAAKLICVGLALLLTLPWMGEQVQRHWARASALAWPAP